jgi:hypothetical protein
LPNDQAALSPPDNKPRASIEYRGEIGVTKTKLEGVYFSE